MVSEPEEVNAMNERYNSLNPCYNGIWFLRNVIAVIKETLSDVLILVIMEFGFWVRLIFLRNYITSLNPCYNGIWFLSYAAGNGSTYRIWVLILVIMEFGFWECLRASKTSSPLVLILVIMEFGFWVRKTSWFWCFHQKS